MVIYGVTIITLVDELQAEDLGLLTPFYTDDTAFYGSSRCSKQILNMTLDGVRTGSTSSSQASRYL